MRYPVVGIAMEVQVEIAASFVPLVRERTYLTSSMGECCRDRRSEGMENRGTGLRGCWAVRMTRSRFRTEPRLLLEGIQEPDTCFREILVIARNNRQVVDQRSCGDLLVECVFRMRHAQATPELGDVLFGQPLEEPLNPAVGL